MRSGHDSEERPGRSLLSGQRLKSPPEDYLPRGFYRKQVYTPERKVRNRHLQKRRLGVGVQGNSSRPFHVTTRHRPFRTTTGEARGGRVCRTRPSAALSGPTRDASGSRTGPGSTTRPHTAGGTGLLSPRTSARPSHPTGLETRPRPRGQEVRTQGSRRDPDRPREEYRVYSFPCPSSRLQIATSSLEEVRVPSDVTTGD